MSKLLLYLCTLMAVLVTVSGWVGVRSWQEAVWQAAFLPVVGYLVGATVKQVRMRRMKPEVKLSEERWKLSVVTAGAVVLVGWGMMQVNGGWGKDNYGSGGEVKMAVEEPMIMEGREAAAEAQIKPQLRIVAPDEIEEVNVRDEPSLGGVILRKIPVGEEMELVGCEEQWCKVKLTAGDAGWVNKDYVLILP